MPFAALKIGDQSVVLRLDLPPSAAAESDAQCQSLNHAEEAKLTFQAHQPGSKGGEHAARSISTQGRHFALIAAIIHYAHLSVPLVHTGFTLLLVGFLVLAAGVVLRGL
jgi:hypothetical protein